MQHISINKIKIEQYQRITHTTKPFRFHKNKLNLAKSFDHVRSINTNVKIN